MRSAIVSCSRPPAENSTNEVVRRRADHARQILRYRYLMMLALCRMRTLEETF
jgi:hypothetical protein